MPPPSTESADSVPGSSYQLSNTSPCQRALEMQTPQSPHHTWPIAHSVSDQPEEHATQRLKQQGEAKKQSKQ